MLRCGKSLRLTSQDIDLLRALGIDSEGVKSPQDFANALAPFLEALGEVRPDLLDRLAAEVIRARGKPRP